MKFSIVFVAGVAASTAMAAPVYQVKQGGTTLGTVQVFDVTGLNSGSGYTLAQAYNYAGSEFNGRSGFFLQSDLPGGNGDLSVLLVRANDGLGVMVIAGDGVTDGGGNHSTQLEVDFTRDFTGLAVQDDAGESTLVSGDIHFSAGWNPNYTDGLAAVLAGGFGAGDELRIRKTGNGIYTPANALTVFGYGSPNNSLVSTDYGGSGSDDIIITMVPLPSGAALAGLGLLGLGVRRRRGSL